MNADSSPSVRHIDLKAKIVVIIEVVYMHYILGRIACTLCTDSAY